MPQARTLNDDEFHIVLSSIERGRHANRNRLVLLLGHWSGLRAGEIAALRIGDVVDPNGRPRQHVHLAPDQTKGSKPRTVHIPTKLAQEVSDYLPHHPYPNPQNPLIYSQKSLRHYRPDTLANMIKTIYRNAGFDDASSHTGRRSFLTHLAAQGVSVRVLQHLAGHRSIATTQRYIDVNDRMLRTAVELV